MRLETWFALRVSLRFMCMTLIQKAWLYASLKPVEKPLKISGAIGDYTKTYDNYIRPVYGDLALIAVTNDIVLELHAKKTAPVMRARETLKKTF